MQTEAEFVKNEKFRLIREIASMLGDAPAVVRHAWQDGWTGIGFYPEGYDNMDFCGCCFTDYPPGWYGYSTEGSWKFICDPRGRKDYATHSWDILDSD